MVERTDKIAIQFRCDAAYNERLERHANHPKYDGSKAHFVRRATTMAMDLEDALGPSFELVIGNLIGGRNAEQEAA
jgi:hypothetical protein